MNCATNRLSLAMKIKTPLIAATLLIATTAAGRDGNLEQTLLIRPHDQPETQFDAHRLQPGRFTYRMVKDGAEIAKFTLTVEPLADGNYRFTGDAIGFEQHWESVTTRYFQPLSAELRLQRSGGQRFAMSLHYSNGQVKGTSVETKPPVNDAQPQRSEKITVADAPSGTVDQRIDWAAMLSSHLLPGQTLKFAVYDPETGLSPVSGEAIDGKQTKVPAGAFETNRLNYRIKKSQRTELYRLESTRDFPRMMIREEFPDGAVTELVEAVPGK